MQFQFNEDNTLKPLADFLRPVDLEDVVGHSNILGDNGTLINFIKKNYVPSIIFWGPPGCGKTTIAKIVANKVNYKFEELPAVSNGAADIRKIFANAEIRKSQGISTLLLVDEIHRFNRAQQDLFLPYIENGTITLFGATTQNPSFELNSALLSRCKVLTLNSLDENSLENLIIRAETKLDKKLNITKEARKELCKMANGDGRYLLGLCEEIFSINSDKILEKSDLTEILQKRFPLYDKSQDGHYNLISALHKSLRGSDADASLYWYSRMMDAGEDPNYILRRLVRFALEDIGIADPNALIQANAAKDAYNFLGSPEGDLAIIQAIVYLATAPKSNAIYKAQKLAINDAKKGSFMPPKHILNAPTKLMKDQGYHEGYIYDHNTKDCFSGQNYFPEEIGRKSYYSPVQRGFEREIKKRMSYWKKLRENN